jgi:hypothetical protein
MLFQEQTPHEQALARLQACSFTLKTILSDIQDPSEPDSRVDLLVACDEVINQANALYNILSSFTWRELDMRNHPSSDIA